MKFLVWWLLSAIVTFIVSVTEVLSRAIRFANEHGLGVCEYLDMANKYVDTQQPTNAMIRILKIVAIQAYLYPAIIKTLNEVEYAYLNGDIQPKGD